MKKVLLILFCLLSLSPLIFADSISGVTVPSLVRMGEKVTIEGVYDDGNAFILCRFLVYDLNGNNAVVERWSDEYTFSDGEFYAEKVLVEPPYFRGDDYNIVVNCGTAQGNGRFTVDQPIAISHPVQKWWEYGFEDDNVDAVMAVALLGSVFVILALAFAFGYKKMRGT